MKVKRVKIGIKGTKDVLDDFVATGEAIERGEEVKREKAIYFESIDGFRKALTPRRLELLRLIREKQPESLQGLSRLAKRDIKSVATDIALLEDLGLVGMKRKKEGRRESTPTVNYNKINLEIAV